MKTENRVTIIRSHAVFCKKRMEYTRLELVAS